MIAPLRQFWQALAVKINSLGINDPTKEFPRIIIDQIELRGRAIVKDAETFEVTFLIDVVTKSDSPVESIDILERVQSIMNLDDFKVDGFIVQDLRTEALTPLYEVDQGIWRQLQRYRIQIT